MFVQICTALDMSHIKSEFYIIIVFAINIYMFNTELCGLRYISIQNLAFLMLMLQ
jgi:hypothetical protein